MLVQNVVDDTAEQIGGSSARKTAAQVAAQAVVNEAKANPDGLNSAKWESYYTNKCNRIKITFSDVDGIGGSDAAKALMAAFMDAADSATADETFTFATGDTTTCKVP